MNYLALILVSLLTLSGCGGGGSADVEPPPIQDSDNSGNGDSGNGDSGNDDSGSDDSGSDDSGSDDSGSESLFDKNDVVDFYQSESRYMVFGKLNDSDSRYLLRNIDSDLFTTTENIGGDLSYDIVDTNVLATDYGHINDGHLVKYEKETNCITVYTSDLKNTNNACIEYIDFYKAQFIEPTTSHVSLDVIYTFEKDTLYTFDLVNRAYIEEKVPFEVASSVGGFSKITANSGYVYIAVMNYEDGDSGKIQYLTRSPEGDWSLSNAFDFGENTVVDNTFQAISIDSIHATDDGSVFISYLNKMTITSIEDNYDIGILVSAPNVNGIERLYSDVTDFNVGVLMMLNS